MTQKKWRVPGKSVLERKRVNLTSDCCVRDGGTIKQQCPVETIEDMVLGGAHWIKFHESRDLTCLVLASRIWHKVGAQ